MGAGQSTGKVRMVERLSHGAFWLFVLLLYAVFFGQDWSIARSLLFVGLLLPVTIAATYFVTTYLIPVYLVRDRPFRFLVYLAYTIVGTLLVEMLVVVLIFAVVAQFNIRDMSPSAIRVPYLLTALLLAFFLFIALELHNQWRKEQASYLALLQQKTEAELRFLKTQLRPHFLFNTLNNIYALSSSGSPHTSEALLSLSRVLDFVLHETESHLIPLQRELDVVNDYVALEQLRYGDRLTLSRSVNGDLDASSIAPLVLLTLMENAFKHGPAASPGAHRIDMTVQAKPEEIVVTLSNTCSASTDNHSGIGLVNLRNQLALVYQDRFKMDAGIENGVFNITLRLS